jgi:exosortase/archaeosortase family protein
MASRKNRNIKIKHGKKQKGTDRISIKRFLLTYFVLMGIFFLLFGLAPIQKYIDINNLYSRSIVFVTHSVLSLMQIQSSYHGTIIDLPNISLDVMFGCNGLEAVMIYSIAVIAFPARWRKRLTGITAGFIVIQIINIIRIVALAYSAVHFKAMFKTIHIYVAQGIMIAVALGIFLIYLNYAGREKEETI